MKRRPNYKDRITKTGEFFLRNYREVGK